MKSRPAPNSESPKGEILPCTVAEAEEDPARLILMAKDSALGVRRGAARNPATPLESLALLAAEYPEDVIGNLVIDLAMAADPTIFQQWSSESLLAIVRSTSVEPALLSILLREFHCDSHGDIMPKGKEALFGALIASPKMPATAIHGFMSRSDRRARNLALEVAAMHPALEPITPTAAGAHDAIIYCLRHGAPRPGNPVALAQCLRSPSPTSRAVIRGLNDRLRVAAVVADGGITSPLFEDLSADRAEPLFGLKPEQHPAELLRDAPPIPDGPASRAECQAWLQSDSVKQKVLALVSAFATQKDLDSHRDSKSPRIRNAAAEGNCRMSLLNGTQAWASDCSTEGPRRRMEVIIRWPSLKGKRLTDVIKAAATVINDSVYRDHPTALQRLKDKRIAICVAALARNDLAEADIAVLVREAPDVITQCAHSTRDALHAVIHTAKEIHQRDMAMRHPNADPADRIWLRSPEGMLSALVAHWLGDAQLKSGDSADDVAALAWETHGARTGDIGRILALTTDGCPSEILEMRSRSTCWIERAIVASHGATPAKVRDRLASDPCWAVRAMAGAAENHQPAASRPSAVRGSKAAAHSKRSLESAAIRPKMAPLRTRLSSPDWAVVCDCIREIVKSGDAELLQTMNQGITYETSERWNHLKIDIDQKSEIYRRVQRGFQEEAALELVKGQLGKKAGIMTPWGTSLTKSLKGINGLPSLEHYNPGLELRLKDCGESWGTKSIVPAAGLDRVKCIDFCEQPVNPDFLNGFNCVESVRGQIPMLPRLNTVKKVTADVTTTTTQPSPFAFVTLLGAVESLDLTVAGLAETGPEFRVDLANHPRLKVLRIKPRRWSSGPSLAMVFEPDRSHASLEFIETTSTRIRFGESAVFPNLTEASFQRCAIPSGIAAALPKVAKLHLDDCAPISGDCLRCAHVKRLKITGHTGLRSLELAPDGLEEFALWRCDDLEQIARPLPLNSLSKFRAEHCESLRTIDLGARMELLQAFRVENCPALEIVSLPRLCPALASVEVIDCKKLRSATQLLGPIPADTPITSVSFRSCEALDNVDILAAFPNIQNIDLCGCKSLRSVAALKSLGPNLRIHMWGAARTSDETKLGPEVVNRRQ